ncbi:hypothetical protein ABZ912_23320 [Nonomuraea angiospora]
MRRDQVGRALLPRPQQADAAETRAGDLLQARLDERGPGKKAGK